jgi:hypothetical protein
MQKVLLKGPLCKLNSNSFVTLHDNLFGVSTFNMIDTDRQLTQSLSCGADPIPISSNVFGPLPGGEDTAGLGAGAAGLLAGAGADAGAACGGGLCCSVGALCGLGKGSCGPGRPAEPGLDEGRDPCPGVVVEGLSARIEFFLLS